MQKFKQKLITIKIDMPSNAFLQFKTWERTHIYDC